MIADSTIIIVPVFNGSDYLEEFLDRIPRKLHSLLLFVNDGSTDDFDHKINELKIRCIKHKHNLGKGAALRTGIEEAGKLKSQSIITLDIDLQHPPEKITSFLPACENRVQLGWRQTKRDMPFPRRVSNFLTSLLISIRTNTLVRDSQCGFRSFPLKLAAELDLSENGFQFESEFLLKAALKGAEVKHIPIPTIYGYQNTAMRPVLDTVKFIRLWLNSFLWT